jgi:hypothetical protein
VDFLEGLKENVKDIRHVTASLENEMWIRDHLNSTQHHTLAYVFL